mmetsp:Transcript_46211/g.108448  ORF Transcript_46211/g.108448 Transcript_46211/m.108448 type:complete len:222 (+) Transcript_46211:608-1273(+)
MVTDMVQFEVHVRAVAAVVVFGRGLEPVRHEDVHAAFVVPTHADRRRVLAEAFPEGERRVHVLWLAFASSAHRRSSAPQALELDRRSRDRRQVQIIAPRPRPTICGACGPFPKRVDSERSRVGIRGWFPRQPCQRLCWHRRVRRRPRASPSVGRTCDAVRVGLTADLREQLSVRRKGLLPMRAPRCYGTAHRRAFPRLVSRLDRVRVGSGWEGWREVNCGA